MDKVTDSLTNENMNEVFISYNDMIQDNASETCVESYKDLNEFLENSDESNFQYSNESENSSIYNTYSTDEKHIPIYSYVSNNFITKKERKYKKCYTASFINNMNSVENFPFKSYGNMTTGTDKTKKIENFQWKPLGKNVPEISLLNMSYKKAWDIGKEGCNGLLIKNIFESYKKKKLHYIVLDGTNIENFLTVYSHTYQETIKGVNPSVLIQFSFYDIEDAYFIYDIKSIHIFRKMKHKEKEKTVILKGLNDNFFNAILVCMNEIIHYLKFVNFKRMMNKSNTKKKKNEELDETTYFVKSARNENNVYNNNIKDVISYNKKKKKINDTYINGESNNKNCENNIVNFGNKNINCNKENKNDFPTILSSNNIEEFGYEYIKDIIKKEEKKLYETDKMYINSNDEYSSHTSDSMSQ
ncbi:conserved Plasmodium protein, unknown function [Plasmodium malariae]|uniref:Uncharacterized protein n=1 Tax=Plasmodium malariae TaxID=5858 RepID=A0A1C3KD41_PLAMA|nr:conserved Plasmodium protein, unknown function [Plasmodium malariae]